MKHLKTTFSSLFILLLIGFSLMSCSSDDDATKLEPKQKLPVGKWYFVSTEQGEDLTECQQTSFLEIKENGEASTIMYMDSPDGSCIPQLGSDFTVKLISDKTIKFTLVDEDGEEEGSSFNSEIISVSETQMVLKDFAFIQGKANFKK